MKQSNMESAKVKLHGLFIKKQLNAEVSLKANGFCSQHKPKGSAFCLFVAHVGHNTALTSTSDGTFIKGKPWCSLVSLPKRIFTEVTNPNSENKYLRFFYGVGGKIDAKMVIQ